ncbi:hypothetical protein [Brevundimonas sp.]|uniref:hypothetical protein n=1 Tax=Brevundimonas sp. TaxID=1871086 RepID=UPI002FC9305A
MFLPVALLTSALLLQEPAPTQTAPSAPATAQTAAPQAEPANLPTVTITAAPVQPTQTCRTEAVTGSRFGRRVCRNNVQSEEDRINSREMLRRLQGARFPDG